MAVTTKPGLHDTDERRLAELGYKQELNRAGSGFQNFAISFTTISVLAGCYTPVVTFGVFIAVGLWWLLSARNWFIGPRRTIDEIDEEIGAPPPFAEAP